MCRKRKGKGKEKGKEKGKKKGKKTGCQKAHPESRVQSLLCRNLQTLNTVSDSPDGPRFRNNTVTYRRPVLGRRRCCLVRLHFIRFNLFSCIATPTENLSMRPVALFVFSKEMCVGLVTGDALWEVYTKTRLRRSQPASVPVPTDHVVVPAREYENEGGANDNNRLYLYLLAGKKGAHLHRSFCRFCISSASLSASCLFLSVSRLPPSLLSTPSRSVKGKTGKAERAYDVRGYDYSILRTCQRTHPTAPRRLVAKAKN